MFIKTTSLASAIATAINTMPLTDVINPKGFPLWEIEVNRDLLSKTRFVSEVRFMPDRTYRVCLTDYELGSDRALFVSKSKPTDFFDAIEDAVERAIDCARKYLKVETEIGAPISEQINNALLFENLISDLAAKAHVDQMSAGNGIFH